MQYQAESGDLVVVPNDKVSQSVLVRMFTMLTRYKMMGNLLAGSQASIGVECWLPLWKYFDVDTECFANPSNRTCNKFASLFKDTDKYEREPADSEF